MSVVLVNGDAARLPLQNESVHCAICSPPYYGLRNYDLPPLIWGGMENCSHVWEAELVSRQRGEVGAHSTLDGGLQSGGVGRLQEVAQGRFCQICGAWCGSLGLEPTPELYVDHLALIFREVHRTLRGDGTLWLNLDDTYCGGGNYRGTDENTLSVKQASNRGARGQLANGRHGQPPGLKIDGLPPKNLLGIPWRVAFALQADGWYLRAEIIWRKTNPMPESVDDRPTRSHEQVFLFSKKSRYFYDAEAIKEPGSGHGHGGGRRHAGRYQAGAYRHLEAQSGLYTTSPAGPSGRNKHSVWTVGTAQWKGQHYASYPPGLVEPCVRAGTSECGVCPECGAPWERVLTTTRLERMSGGRSPKHAAILSGGGNRSVLTTNRLPSTTTIGWLPGCDCYGRTTIPRYPYEPDDAIPPEICPSCGGTGEIALWGFMSDKAVGCQHCHGRGIVRKPNGAWVNWRAASEAINSKRVALVEQFVECPREPATVLDPFCGTGTTLMVARALGRHGVGIDLSLSYLQGQARSRLQLDAWDSWHNPQERGQEHTSIEGDWQDLPLFSGTELAE